MLHIFGFWEVNIEIEVFDVGDETFCSWSGDELLKRHFVVVTVAVGVLNSPAKPRRFPPTVSRV